MNRNGWTECFGMSGRNRPQDALFDDHFTNPLKISVFKPPTIDEYGRCPTHFGLAAVSYVTVDFGLQGRIFAVIVKLNHSELKPGRDLLDFLFVYFIVFFKQLFLKYSWGRIKVECLRLWHELKSKTAFWSENLFFTDK